MHRLIIALFILLPSAAVLAQDTTEYCIPEQELPQTTVIASKDRLLTSVPGSATYVSPLQMKRIQPLSGNEVFRKIPGVHVVDEEGLGFRANIGIRGLNPDRSANVLVLEDGIPVQLNPYGEPELYYTPSIDRMQAIEVVKGSGQIMFGPRTIGGVINYITPDAPKQQRTNVKLSAGSGGFVGAQIGYGNTFGRAGFQVNYNYKRADMLGTAAFDIHDLNAKVNFNLSEKSLLGIKLQVYDETSNSTYIGLTQPMYDAGQYYTVMAPDDQLKIRRYALSAIHKHFFNNNLKLTNAAYLYTISRDWRRQNFSSSRTASNQTGVVWGDSTISNGAIFMQDATLHRNRSYEVGGLESKLTWNYKLLGQTSQLDAGIRVHTERASEHEIAGSSPTALSGTLVNDERRPGMAYSGFVQNKFQVLPNLSIHAGLRVEHYRFKREVLLVSVAGTLQDTLISAPSQVSAIIPGIGFSYQLNKNVNIFGGVHKGFAPPLIKNSVSKAGEVFQLDAQESWNYELGSRMAFGKGIEAELTGFWIDFQKQVIPVSESAGGTGSGFANAGATVHRGVETSIRLDLGAMLDSKYSIYWEGNLTWINAIFDEDRFIGTDRVNVKGNALPYAPSWLTNHTLGFAAPWGLDLQLSSTFVSQQFADELNTEAASANGRNGLIPAYFVLDASARYTYKPWNTSVFVSAKNLTNERYIASRRPQGIRVGLPLTIIAGAEVNF